MKINIYGVGRSGTKAIQLWIAYVLFREKGPVQINYEPFRYKSRTLEFNGLGQAVHRYTPLFLDDRSTTPPFLAKFCQNLARNDNSVTKFIRGNGRIGAINKLMEPDVAVLVIRDLYQVLESILLQPWDLAENPYEWKRLYEFASIRYPELNTFDGEWQQTGNRVVRNAVYWFVMNMYALENLDQRTLIIDLSDITPLQEKFSQFGFQSAQTIDLSCSVFRGNNIHKQIFLKTISESKSKIGNSASSYIRKGLLKLLRYRNSDQSGKWRKIISPNLLALPTIINEDTGNSCLFHSENSLLQSIPERVESKRVEPPIRVQVPRNDFLDLLSMRVNEKKKESQAYVSK